MAMSGRLPDLLRSLLRPPPNARGIGSALVSNHTAKWMQVLLGYALPAGISNSGTPDGWEGTVVVWDTGKKSPMELINEVPPIKVEGRIVACEGDSNPALGHPIEFICLDLKDPAICKYCGLRYVQHDHHH